MKTAMETKLRLVQNWFQELKVSGPKRQIESGRVRRRDVLLSLCIDARLLDPGPTCHAGVSLQAE